jgi:membrane protease YdiL (CAAX protease family)
MSEFYSLETEKKSNKRIINRIGWSLVALMIFSQIGAAIFMVICALFFENLTRTSIYNFIISTLPIYFIAFPIFMLIIRKVPKECVSRKSSLTISQIIQLIIISFGALFIFNIFGDIINFIISILKGSPVENPLENLLSKVNIFETLIFAGILAPIMEEIIFRKVLLSRLRRFGDFFSIFLSSLAFAMFHGNLSQFFYAFALGCIFAYVVIKTGTIKYTIMLHITVNMFGAIIIPQITSMQNTILNSLMGCFVTLITLGSIALVVINRKKIILESGSINLNKKEQLGFMFKNSGMIVYSILFILSIMSVILTS